MPTPKDKRNYEAEYADESPARRKARADRMAARRAYEKKHGDMPSTTHVDHMTPISGGGSGRDIGNLRALPKKDNESFKRRGPGGKQVGSAKKK